MALLVAKNHVGENTGWVLEQYPKNLETELEALRAENLRLLERNRELVRMKEEPEELCFCNDCRDKRIAAAARVEEDRKRFARRWWKEALDNASRQKEEMQTFDDLWGEDGKNRD